MIMASSKAPYYYGELIKKDNGSGGVNVSVNANAMMRERTSSTPLVNMNNSVSAQAQQMNDGSPGAMNKSNNNVGHNQHTPLTDESPSSSSLTLSRPPSSSNMTMANNVVLSGSQSHYGMSIASAATTSSCASSSSTIPASFANPLLAIEPDTRGTESLPRTFQQRKPNLFQKQSKQGIYQRSLSLLANGVSPLLRKKKSSSSTKSSSSSNANANQSEPNETASSTLSMGSNLSRRRRKSEPIMFSLDSITNEINRLQQRQEQILENLNLDFETMLMNDANSALLATGNGNSGVNQSGGHAITNNGTSSMHNLSSNAMNTSGDAYGKTIQQPDYGKESFYSFYEDSSRSCRAEDNIYEEIDFMTLTSLRAQYADTLSLQSYKKKGKRSTSSSFTRWFSTRKKSSPTSLNSEEENPYIDIKFSKKQRPPICLPEMPPPGLTPEQLKRRYIVGSIVDSENSYINSLQRIINQYKKPLEDSNPPALSQNKINIIFHRLEQILQCHTIFGIALSQCVREWDDKERIGDVFIASFSKSMVLDIYSDFINNFTNAMETARKASKSKSAFAQFLHDRSLSSPDRLSFFGLMVKPVQRFPQFILLLSDLLKHTPADHVDRMSLQLALTQLESLADRLNERKRDAERHFAVKQLLKDYLSNSATNSSHRYLLRQDDVYMLDLDASTGLVLKTKCRKLYLLNDMLVCVSVPSNRLKFAVSLQDVDVIDDVTPATNNLIANSMLRSKDAGTGATNSPQHCTVERMYCDLNNLIHDLEVMSRISNLVSSLRYQYNGLSVELTEQISGEIREEIRRKDAQITLIDRSCMQLRIRSKNYKDVICIQMSDPDVKRDWLTDVRLAKLALDRANNPAWDIVSENISSSSNSIHTIVQQRVPLFVKSLPIFATSDHSQLTCALHYKLFRPTLTGESETGVLWICNVNMSGSQLGALATNGADLSLIHSYELCDSHVTCIEAVGSYSVWIGLRQGRIIVIDANSPGEWQQFAALDVASQVTCIKHFGQYVYVGLITGVVALFNATHYEEPIIITLSQSPVTCLLPINNEMFVCSHNKIWVLNATPTQVQVDRSYCLEQPELDDEAITVPQDDVRPNLLAHCGIGLWVSLIDSSIIKLYHTETFKHLQDLNVASNVKRILNEGSDIKITVTSMLATRGLLWIGTNVGVIVTLTLPRLQGVPLVSGCLNVALHRHMGPVTILSNLTPGAECPNQTQNSLNTPSKSPGGSDMVDNKPDDVESIYGLYSDLMNVGDYVGVKRSGRHHVTTTKMAWDLSNMNISDDSTSESASSGAIYHDGTQVRQHGGQTQLSQMMNNSIVDASMSDAVMQRNNHLYEASGMTMDGRNSQAASRHGNNIYDTARPASSNSAAANAVSNAVKRREKLMPIYDSTPNNNGNNNNAGNTGFHQGKTALLLTGGNGYKRGTVSESPYSSQHAHCILWEYKL